MRVTGLASWSALKRLGIIGVALLLLIAGAAIVDYYRFPRAKTPPPLSVAEDIQQVLIGTVGKPYVDPNGRFSIVPPAGWEISPHSAENFYDVSFINPGRASLNILASPVPYNDLRKLYEEIHDRERSFSVYTKLETTRFGDQPAIQRTAQLPGKKLKSYDFVQDHVAYHILYEVPDDFEKDYTFAIEEVLKTFHATPPAPPADAPAETDAVEPSTPPHA